jgi:hypothetical protein
MDPDADLMQPVKKGQKKLLKKFGASDVADLIGSTIKCIYLYRMVDAPACPAKLTGKELSPRKNHDGYA